MRLRDSATFRRRLLRVLAMYEAADEDNYSVLNAADLKVSRAQLSSDIIWENQGKNQTWALMKKVFLFVVLVIFSFAIMTPTYAIGML